jgi:hypothetical protein
LPQRRAVDPFPLGVEATGQQFASRREYCGITKPVGPEHALVDQITCDPVLRDASADQVHGIDRTPIDALRHRRTQLMQQTGLAQRITAEHEAAIATGCTEANVFCLDHKHVAVTTIKQATCRCQPGVTGTDHNRACCSVGRNG